MFNRKRSGQSILEYSIMLAVVIAALLIMQAFVKKGYQGGLKQSADKMGEQFSAGNTTIKEESTMAADQSIHTEVATTGEINDLVVPEGINSQAVIDKGVYSYNERVGPDVVSTTESKTDAARQEDTRIADYENTSVDDFADPTL